MTATARRLTAEALGAGLLVTAVVGSGIMASRLTTDVGLQLVINALATVAALGVLIACLSTVSGAHFNPAVTLVAVIRREMRTSEGAGYVAAQVGGALLGVALANVMFGLPAWTASTHQRDGAGVLLGEVVATAGLIAAIGALGRSRRNQLAAVVIPAWIGAAYFFTSSTSFANPAVTIARSLTDTFAGIATSDVLPFIGAELIGSLVGAGLVLALWPARPSAPDMHVEATHDHV